MAFWTIVTVAILSATTISAVEVDGYHQGFRVSDQGWFDSTTTAEPWHGIIERVHKGEQGVDSSVGAFHATVENDGTNLDGPFSRFGGYSDEFPTGGYVAELDVYLDPDWDQGNGFDYSVAANGSDGAHQRDFIFHVTKDTSENALLLGVSNNSNFNPKETIENGNHFNFAVEGQTAGWYKLRHRFWDDDGLHRVDLSLLDANGTVLFTETLPPVDHPIQDPIADVGGNRYAWFTAISADLTLHIDEQRLCLGTECTHPGPPPNAKRPPHAGQGQNR